MSKQEIVHQLTALLRKQFTTMTGAARATHDAATGDESKQESKYDTRALEASYLAAAQTEQCQQLGHALHLLESFTPVPLPAGSAIGPGALVETELDGFISYYLLTPCAGGMVIEYNGCDLTTLSPDSPLYQNFLGHHAGDLLDAPEIMILDVQ